MKPQQQQRGAATLIVVMILFFIMAMMAGFANRNLIFEQRIASNYYRSGVALEAAEAGSEWALARLNGTHVNATCTGAGATTTFRQRYIDIEPSTRVLKPIVQANVSASCVRVADQGWECQCPAGGWVAADVAAATQMQPSFDVSFGATGRPGVVSIIANGCTGSQSDLCRTDPAAANQQLLGAAVVRVEAALVSALKMPPATPLTVRQTVTDGVGALGLHNSDPRSSGLLLLTGGAAPVLNDDRLDSLPGTPGQQALISGDLTLGDVNLTDNKMFAMFFGMAPDQYQTQPAIRSVPCVAGVDCSGLLLAAYNRGVRIAWVNGPLTLTTNVTLGTPTAPMLLVVNDAVNIDAPLIFNGLLYARGNIVWNNSSGQLALLKGAMIGAGTFTATGRVDLWYEGAIIDILSNAMGSFVRVPGSWWDGN